MKVKLIYISILLCCMQSCTSQEVNRIEYQTIFGFPLTEQQVKSMKTNYFELGYHNDELLHKTMKSSRNKNSYTEYFNISNRKEDSIKRYIDEFSTRKLNNGSRINTRIFPTIFTDVEDNKVYVIQNKETYSKSVIQDETYVISNSKILASKKDSRLNKNDEFNKGAYSYSSNKDYEKYYYNLEGKITLYCNYKYREGECYVCKQDLEGNIKTIETFKLSDFNKLKQKYFPFENISYLENEKLNPKKSYIKAQNIEAKEVIDYKTEIGTETSKELLSLLDNYSKFTYQNNGLKKVEVFKENKPNSIQYYLSENESLEEIKLKFKNDSDYVLITSDKTRGIQVFNHYKNNELVRKERIKKDENRKVVAKEIFKKNNLDEPDYSKTIKMYKTLDNAISLTFYYQRNSNLKNIIYKRSNNNLNTSELNMYNWEEIKKNYFPNEDLEFYKTAKF